MKARITIEGKLSKTIDVGAQMSDKDNWKCITWTDKIILKQGEIFSFELIPESLFDRKFLYGKEEINLHDTIDARIWEEEFLRIVKETDCFIPEPGFMAGWFANAMMARHDFDNNKLKVIRDIVNNIGFDESIG